jgi:phosphonatase-like hydrolase
MIKMIIFDMAGTTVNEDNIVYKTIRDSLSDFGYYIQLELVLLHGAGKEKSQAIRDILSEVTSQHPDKAEVSAIYHDFREKLQSRYKEYPIQLFTGVPEVINFSKENGIKIVFNTGYSRIVAEGILKRVGLQVGRDIDLLITADDVMRNRPAPDMIHLACNSLKIPANQTIKIGDSQIDIEEGKNAGVLFTIGITSGAQTRETLAKSHPDFIIDHLEELTTKIWGQAIHQS